MKKMMKLLSLVLVLALVLSLAACSGTKTATIVGKWSTTMDMEKMMEKAAEGGEDDLGGMMEAFGSIFKGVVFKINLEFNEDGTFVMSTDEDSMKAAAELLVSNAKEALGELAESMDVSDLTNEFGGDMNEKGTYTYEDGKLTLKGEEDAENDAMVWVVELTATELKVTDIEGEEDDSYKAMLPLVFTK